MSMFDALFGCSHNRTSFPITPRRTPNATRQGTYVTCLDCGKEFPYNWDQMRIITEETDKPHFNFKMINPIPAAVKAVPPALSRFLRFGN